MRIGDYIEPTGAYRYWLGVEVERYLFSDRSRLRRYILLNPSTASAKAGLDPTTQRLLDFSLRDGYDGYYLGNAYGLRATKPEELWKCKDPVGPENDKWLRDLVAEAVAENESIVVAWGQNLRKDRLAALREILTCPLLCFGTNSDGSPKHPLYLTKQTQIVPWTWP